MTKLSDLTTATRLRDVISAMVRDILKMERPADVYATVEGIDRVARTATVSFPGEATPVTLPMSVLQPTGTGGVVRVVGTRNDRRIEAPSGTAGVYVDANTVAATTLNATTATITTGNITTGNITTTTSTTANVATGNITTVNATDVTATGLVRSTKTTEPALGATTHGFEVGTPGNTAGQTGIMFGPSRIQAKNGNAAAAIELNNAGGAVRANGFPVAPLRAIGYVSGSPATLTATGLDGTPPAIGATSPGFQMQAGIASVAFTNGGGSFALPNAFPNGLLCCLTTTNDNHLIYAISRASSRSTIVVTCHNYGDFNNAWPTVFNGTNTFTYLAIGW